ncbi:MAG: DUF3224 domain-containing protein [Dehalococcoidia bacterium]
MDMHGTGEIIPGSGTGDLAGLRGSGRLTFHQRPPRGEYSFDGAAS